MKRHWICAAALAVFSASSAMAADDLTQTPHFGAWGVDLAARDTAMKPGDDFYRFAQGKATDALQIPPDRTWYGAVVALRELSQARSRAVIEKAAADTRAVGDEAKIGAFYRAFMDESRVERLGDKPMRKDLKAIRQAANKDDIAAIMGAADKGYGASFFGMAIETDAKASSRYVVHVGQSGLGMPDRDYYLQPSFAPQKEKYQAYVAQMLGMIGWPDAQAQAKAIVALESEVATVSWVRADRRDDTKTYNPTTPDQLAADAPGFPWRTFLASADLSGAKKIIADENTAIPKIAAIYAKTPLDTLKAWLAFNLVDNAAPELSKRFVDANFEFRSKVLSGQEQQRPRWKRGVELLDGQLGEAVGRLYVAEYFPPESKAKMAALVDALRASFRARIQKVDWMSAETKSKALEKLAKFNVKIGYPTKWRDYSSLHLSSKHLYDDAKRATAFEWARQVHRLNDPVDRQEWFMTPQTVNAYYSQTENEIVFPAAMLQPPFFDPNADMAANFGGIGAIIGHEMTHGFDDQGRQSDGDGMLKDWWTADDAARFKVEASKLGAEYSAVEPIKGVHINGDLTMGENIADLGGVLLALDAYHASLGAQPAPVIDGLTGDQRLFLAWAQNWRSKFRDDFLRRLLVTDPHPPSTARANIPLRNVDAWYEAFGVKPGDALYLPPEQRVHIW